MIDPEETPALKPTPPFFVFGASLLAATASPVASAQSVVARALSADGDLGLTSYVNAFDPAGGGTAFTSAGDGFGIFQRGVSAGIPFALLDDSVTFTADTLGVVDGTNTAPFFGITDNVNGDSTGADSASFTFDTSSIIGPATLTFDLAAMGDFEDGVFSSNIFGAEPGTPGLADEFSISASSDGGAEVELGAAVVLAGPDDAEITQTYTLESGTEVTLTDPLAFAASGSAEVLLNNEFQTFTIAIADPGDSLTINLNAFIDGGEAIALQNLTISGVIPEPASLAVLGLGSVVLMGRRRQSA